ncbi:hypothetical protein GCM10028832_07450 [Streptomyces sparsus]
MRSSTGPRACTYDVNVNGVTSGVTVAVVPGVVMALTLGVSGPPADRPEVPSVLRLRVYGRGAPHLPWVETPPAAGQGRPPYGRARPPNTAGGTGHRTWLCDRTGWHGRTA